ncbi:MAG TPA: glycosyltransferase [Acidimicrobiales bacterium]
MRVLVTSTPGTGHVLPMVPVVQALRDRGHEVVWATGPDAHALVADAGLTAVAAGLEGATRNKRFVQAVPDLASLPPRRRRGVLFPTMFAGLATRPMYDDLARLVEGWAPDLVVHEPCELAAAPLARGLGVPSATVGFGRFFPEALLASAVPELTEVWGLVGSAVPADLGFYDHAYLHPLPPTMEPAPAGRPIHLARPMGYDGSDEPLDPVDPPAPAAEPSARPSVYVTFGTEFGPMAPWPVVLEALATLDVDALLTVGGRVDPDALGPLPAGVRVERWVPQRQALREADVVVSHGGSGAMLGASAAGLPQLLVPIAADQFDNADLIVDHGSGLMVEGRAIDAESIAAAMARLLTDTDIRHDAERAAVEIAAMPSPGDAAGELERLVE